MKYIEDRERKTKDGKREEEGRSQNEWRKWQLREMLAKQYNKKVLENQAKKYKAEKWRGWRNGERKKMEEAKTI